MTYFERVVEAITQARDAIDLYKTYYENQQATFDDVCAVICQHLDKMSTVIDDEDNDSDTSYEPGIEEQMEDDGSVPTGTYHYDPDGTSFLPPQSTVGSHDD